jgi:energy-coupling factor transporter transmembrane protein EcfT
MTFIRVWRFITLMLASLSLSLPMTHLLELPQRMKFDQELWVKVTIFANLYRLFGSVGAVFEITAILMAIVLVFLVRKRGLTFYWTLGGSLLLVLAFVSWIMFVAPMNAEFAQWLTNPVPVDWTRYRDQWEYGHALIALIKILGLSLLMISVLVETPKKRVDGEANRRKSLSQSNKLY